MFKVSVYYPNESGKKFDMDYYIKSHITMVHRLLDSEGLVRTEIEKGISDADPSAQPRFVAVGALYFEAVEQVHAAFMTHGKEIMGDIPNYTDIKPEFLISEVLG